MKNIYLKVFSYSSEPHTGKLPTTLYEEDNSVIYDEFLDDDREWGQDISKEKDEIDEIIDNDEIDIDEKNQLQIELPFDNKISNNPEEDYVELRVELFDDDCGNPDNTDDDRMDISKSRPTDDYVDDSANNPDCTETQTEQSARALRLRWYPYISMYREYTTYAGWEDIFEFEGIGNGDLDGTHNKDDDDAMILFSFIPNDEDSDGLTFYTEGIYEFGPGTSANRIDQDLDNIPDSFEWWYNFKSSLDYCDPFDNDKPGWMEGDDDRDGFYIDEEFETDEPMNSNWRNENTMWAFGARPFQKDIFVEVDWWTDMNMEDESQNLVIRAFAKKNIWLHFDDGWMGGGKVLEGDDKQDEYPKDWDESHLKKFGYNWHHLVILTKSSDKKNDGESTLYGSGDPGGKGLKLYKSHFSKTYHEPHIFMHELGHNLGLDADYLYKNKEEETIDDIYQSVMKYGRKKERGNIDYESRAGIIQVYHSGWNDDYKVYNLAGAEEEDPGGGLIMFNRADWDNIVLSSVPECCYPKNQPDRRGGPCQIHN